jgi:hypothetical protein
MTKSKGSFALCQRRERYWRRIQIIEPVFARDFMKIRSIFEKHRTKERIKNTKRQIYNYVKKLILFAEDEELETIHKIVHEIAALFHKNVDKNVQKTE